MASLPSGHVQMLPVSEQHPLNLCRHFVACRTMDVPLELGDHDAIFAFYANMGIMLFETICDGDCGPDAACMMLGLPRTFHNRQELRTEVARYLFHRREMPWMLDRLVSLQELNAEDVESLRSGGVSSALVELDFVVAEKPAAPLVEQPAMADHLAAVEQPPAVADQLVVVEESAVADDAEMLDAIRWATGVKDLGSLYRILTGLPDWTKQEQLVAYRNREIVAAKKNSKKTDRISVVPSLVSSRMKVAAAYHDWLRSSGCLCGRT